MFTLSKICAVLTGHRTVTEKTFQDFIVTGSSKPEHDIDTEDDDATEFERATRLHSLSSYTDSTDNVSRADSSICLKRSPRSRGELVTGSTFGERPALESNDGDPAPFPKMDPFVLATGSLHADDPPNIQGLPLATVHDILEKLREDSLSGTLETCADESSSLELLEEDEEFSDGLDTSVDFTSVSRSSSSASLECVGQHGLSQSSSEEHAEAVQTGLQTPRKGPDEPSELLEDPYGPRYQLPGEDISDYAKRASARWGATLARTDPKNRVRAYSSCSSNSSSEDDFSNSEDDSKDNSPSCPSSPSTPLNHHNLSKLQNLDVPSESVSHALDTSSEWTPPPMTGPPIFNLSKTRLTPPRKEVYKHIDFCPLDLFHDKGRGRLVLLEQDCLQCILKNMKCDRFHPCCTRCVRAGNAPYCLQQRLLPPWELKQLGLDEIKYVALTRLPEDHDEVWARKLEMEEVLLGELQERIDRRNWVMPINDGKQDIFDEDEIQGKQVCEERGKIWEYKFVDDGLRVVVEHY
jgi:hypothetical protein